MPMQPADPAALERYRTLADEVLNRVDATDGKLFGMPTLKAANGKAFAGVSSQGMVFKLTDAAVRAEALALPGARTFDPAGGRPMREWVVLGPEHEDRFLELALAAHAGV